MGLSRLLVARLSPLRQVRCNFITCLPVSRTSGWPGLEPLASECTNQPLRLRRQRRAYWCGKAPQAVEPDCIDLKDRSRDRWAVGLEESDDSEDVVLVNVGRYQQVEPLAL